MGYAAREIISSADKLLGEVHSSFTRAFNVQTNFGRIVSFSVIGSPNFPSNVVTTLADSHGFSSLGVAPGLPVWKADDTLLVGRMEIYTQSASEYTPLIRSHIPSTDSASLDKAVFGALEVALELSGKGSLIALLPSLERNAEPPSFENLVYQRVWQGLEALRESVLGGRDLAEAASHLLGLGPGLTPSGDDVLAGFMAALRLGLKSRNRSNDNEALDLLLKPVVTQAEAATNTLSREMLLYASRGELTDTAERLILCLLGGCAEDITPHVFSLLAYGATSGADQLTGILHGLRTAYEL
jgi:hypothetical protein